ncbi:MAG: succinylglutamate desuccinylase/aspartoacylase family protein [Alphaproteobacteria bacterium]|nr:succinylglutamate desuccinylase/aspartoacylase family protein [Alphaproteobacteria bacterium]
MSANPSIEIQKPDLSPYREGSSGIPYVMSLDSGKPGPHAVITALVHGNELSGAWALITLMQQGIRPKRGRLSLAFANVQAFKRFDPGQPKASRYLDQDFNRLWDERRLNSMERSRELDRARELRPLIESADWLLDLHSMQYEAEPLLLAGLAEKGLELAQAMGYPRLIVTDAGHRNGARLRDFGIFADARRPETAMLVECGQHWARSSIDIAITSCRQFLAAIDLVEPARLDRLGRAPKAAPQQVIEVTEAMTVKSGPFRFSRTVRGLDVVPKAGTVIAFDGNQPVTTPYDNCVLIMPSKRLTRGLTAVRLGRFVDG